MPCVAIDLFCGIGGLTKGLSLAGVTVAAGFDIDKSCQYAYEANNDAIFYHRDITTIQAEELNELYPQGCIKALVGCAPCQPFSRYSSRYRKDGRKDDKWKLLYSFRELISAELPEIISMENVPSLANEKVFLDFIKTLNQNGYYVDWKVVYCPQYGVPQNRKRLVLLASRLGEIKLIEPLYNEENYLTVRNAIGNLPPIAAGEVSPQDPMHRAGNLTSRNLERIMQSVPGGTWRDWEEDLRLI